MMEKPAKIDRRIVKTRAAINNAFLELLSEKDFQLITINDIADRANVNRGTVYLHYTDKYDLLDQNIEAHVNWLHDFCGTNGESLETGAAFEELEAVFTYLEQKYSFFSVLFASGRTAAFRERMLRYVSASLMTKLKARQTRTEIDDELNAQFMASAFVGIVEWWIVRSMPHPPAYMAAQLRLLYAKNDLLDEQSQDPNAAKE